MTRPNIFAIVAVVVWNAALYFSREVGPWMAMPPAAIGLGLGVLLAGSPAGLLRIERSIFLVGISAGALLTAASYGGWLAVREIGFARAGVELLYAWTGPMGAMQTVLLVVVVAGEELVWRGVLLDQAVGRFGVAAGTVVASVVYAGAHVLSGNAVLVAAALSCGLFWAFVRVRWRSLWASFLCHLIWDVAILVVAPLR